MPKLLEIADVIVYGRIRSIEARLSVDKTVVNTDYVIEPITVFKEPVGYHGSDPRSHISVAGPKAWR